MKLPTFLQTPTAKRVLRLAVPIIFYGLLILFLYLYLKHIDFDKLRNVEFSWGYLILATVLALAARYWGVYIWFVILKSLGAVITDWVQLVYVYSKAWMGRYIPGTAPWILGKIYFASQHGIPREKLAVSSLLEAGLQIMVMLVFSFFCLIFDKRLDVIGTNLKVLMFAVMVIGIVVLIPAVFNRFFSFAYKLVRHKKLDPEHLPTSSTMAKGAGLYLFGAIINGLSLFFIAKGFFPGLGYDNILFAMGAASLATAASMLAVFAPSGVGVREGIQLVLFSLIMPKEIALVVTIATRLWSVGIDFVFLGCSKALVWGYRSSKRRG